MEKKRILFIIWSFTYGGGAEKILANIVNNLNRDKYDIEILEFLHSNIGKEEVKDYVKILPPIIDVTDKSIIARIKNKVFNKLVYIAPGLIRKMYLNRCYDVEVSFNYLIPTFLLNKKSKKLISWIHSSINDLKYDLRLRNIQKKYLSHVDTIVAISKQTEQSIIDVFPEFTSKICRIYNGYDFLSMSLNNGKIDHFDLLFCNRLDDNKNPLFFLDVIKFLKNKGYNFSTNILGTGDLHEILAEKIVEYGLEDMVKMKGYIKNPYDFYRECNVFCLTSKAEGFPTTIVEAMYFGKPFITTPVAGSEELSCDGACGLIANTVESYANAIIKILTDSEIYSSMSERCSKEVLNYSLSKQIESIETLLDS